MKASSAIVLCLGILLSLPAAAQINNGDFEAGLGGWASEAPTGWVVSSMSSGGNPDGRALIQNDPYGLSAGHGCILQSFECGASAPNQYCIVSFDYLLQSFGMPGLTVHVSAVIDGAVQFDAAYTTSTPAWVSASATVPCGVHTLGLCLDVPPGGVEPTFWRVSFDNVTASCHPTIGVQPSPWGAIKRLFR